MRTKPFAMKISSLLLSSLLWGRVRAMTGMETCQEQSNCVVITIEKVLGGPCSIGECDVKVCLEVNLDDPLCAKGDADTVSHMCSDQRTANPDTCTSGVTNFPFAFIVDEDYSDAVPDGVVQCQIVPAGSPAAFILKDGRGCNTDGAIGGTFPISQGSDGVTRDAFCEPRNENFFVGCSGNKPGVECVWVVPTPDDSCDTLPDPKPPVPPGGGGDPHFKTWNGEQYNFQGACDLVMLHSEQFANGLGLDIHVRTKHRRSFSFIQSAAIRIGDEVLEIQGHQYYLNGIANGDLSSKLHGFEVTHKAINDKQQTYMIHLGGHEVIVVRTWKDFVTIKIEHATPQNFMDSVGLLGSFVGGIKLGRNGAKMADDNAFGMDWQVLTSEPKLFQSLSLPAETCTLPPTTSRRRLGEGISEQAAKRACAHIADPADLDFCVYDVMATNDIGVAGSY